MLDDPEHVRREAAMAIMMCLLLLEAVLQFDKEIQLNVAGRLLSESLFRRSQSKRRHMTSLSTSTLSVNVKSRSQGKFQAAVVVT